MQTGNLSQGRDSRCRQYYCGMDWDKADPGKKAEDKNQQWYSDFVDDGAMCAALENQDVDSGTDSRLAR
jgi:hypothetical protein